MNKKKKRLAEQRTFLAVPVESYEADLGAGLNLSLVTIRPYNDAPEDFVSEYRMKLVLKETACYSPERLGEKYEVTFRGNASHGSEL